MDEVFDGLSPPHGESLCPNLWTTQVIGLNLNVTEG